MCLQWSFASTCRTVTWVVNSEMFPLNIRSKHCCYCLNCNPLLINTCNVHKSATWDTGALQSANSIILSSITRWRLVCGIYGKPHSLQRVNEIFVQMHSPQEVATTYTNYMTDWQKMSKSLTHLIPSRPTMATKLRGSGLMAMGTHPTRYIWKNNPQTSRHGVAVAAPPHPVHNYSIALKVVSWTIKLTVSGSGVTMN
jgi:hypothetical protein